MKLVRLNFVFVAISILLFPYIIIAQNLSKQLPLEVSFRKSFLGGSYVLQLKNTSDSLLNIWIDARDKKAFFKLRPNVMKSIGWAQGFRFDANDIFVIGADGYNIFKGTMPSEEINEFRIDFSKNGGVIISLSKSFIQKQISEQIKLPIKEKIPNIAQFEINQMPLIFFQDNSNKIYVKIDLQTFIFSGKIKLPVKIITSFVPNFNPSTGEVIASQSYIEELGIENLPENLFKDLKNLMNEIILRLFSEIVVFKLDKTILKYCDLLNVRNVIIKNRRLQIEIL